MSSFLANVIIFSESAAYKRPLLGRTHCAPILTILRSQTTTLVVSICCLFKNFILKFAVNPPMFYKDTIKNLKITMQKAFIECVVSAQNLY